MNQHHEPHQVSEIETPFHCRNLCWFCGEPSAMHFHFPNMQQIVLSCVHPHLVLNSCRECISAAKKSKGKDIWQVFNDVKRWLINTYRKDLAIGVNWTQEELANSQFEEGNFAGFQRSAWFMYEVAKARVNFQSWPIVVNGIKFTPENSDIEAFQFDGVTYPTIEQALDHYAEMFALNKPFLRQILARVGSKKFAFAISLCRRMLTATPDERALALKELA